MDLFLIPNNPENCALVSINGVAHYQVSTTKTSHSQRASKIQRPAESEEDSIVAEIDWGNWDRPTVVRSCPLVRAKSVSVLASEFLYKKHRFSSSRYFVGDDTIEYRWKFVKGVGCVLMRDDTKEEVACYSFAISKEGLYAGEKKSRLTIQPCSVELDLIVVSFLIMLKKRREKVGPAGDFALCAHDEDPQGDGGGDGGSGGS
ncbi:MAG: TonB box-containing protein [Lentinula lateritia]|uniref:TonB box-containing protein n=1 Tax=Lentinula lateritia TaxID=40482 RepID=A0ABQ8VEQ9_9AGAR|nr:TonB box-containing protein [Lentinula edodes]KAJ3931744.1 MAG: TonB box-containing protein [Lentinula lateritia]KAJ4491763.1 TonB box-containing protein [Lentinula lateritia]